MVYIGTNIIKLVAFYNFNSKKLGKCLQVSKFCVPLPR